MLTSALDGLRVRVLTTRVGFERDADVRVAVNDFVSQAVGSDMFLNHDLSNLSCAPDDDAGSG